MTKTVSIPISLVEKLKPFGPRFIKVEKPTLGDEKSGKKAVEHAWQEHPYKADDAELQKWLQDGGNYGIVFGQGVIGIDLDCKDLRDAFLAKVNTFSVRSGRKSGEGSHAYCRSDATENGTILDESGKNLGNIQVHNKFTVGPNCNHNSGGTYEIINDVPLAWVSKQELEEIFGDKLKWAGKRKQEHEEQAKEEKGHIDFEIPIQALIPNFSELKKISREEFQGENPFHGSTTGANFCVNKAKNCFHCFRCNSGGGPLMLLAVKYGLISCAQAQPGALRGDLFRKTLELARKEGYDVTLPENEETEPSLADETGDKKYERIKLTQITSSHCKKPIEANVLISGVSASYRVPVWAQIKASACTIDGNCPLLKGISSWFSVDDQVKFIEKGEGAQRSEAAKMLIGRECHEKLNCFQQNCLKSNINLRMGTLTECYAIDAVDELKLDEKSMAPRIVKIYTAKEPPQSGSVVVCQGTVGALPRTSQLVFIAEKLTESQKDVDTFDLEKAKSFLSATNMDEQVRILQNATGAVGREDLLQAVLLTYCSPLYLTWKNVTIPGWLLIEIYGDTRTFKSEAAKRVRKLLGFGLYVSMETGGRTGILYSISQTKTGYIILWGELIYADRGVLVIDGANRLKGEEWVEFREARSDGLVKVRRAAKGEAWCRVRQIFIRNPDSGEALKNFPYRLQAIKYQPPDIARYDLFIPVWEEHVEKIIERPPLAIDKLDETASKLRNVVLWCQSRKPEQVVFTDDAVKEVETQAKKFYKKYACSDFPVVTSDFDKKVAKLSAAWAGATVNTDETCEKIVVTKEIVEKACSWYDHVLTLNQLDEFAKIQKRMTDVSDEELKLILADLQEDNYVNDILDTLLKEGAVRRDVLAAGLGVSEKTISGSMTVLKKHRLIRSKPSGYQLTPRGIIVAKKVAEVAEVAGLGRPYSTTSTNSHLPTSSKRSYQNNQNNLQENKNLTDWSEDFEEQENRGESTDE